MMLKAARQHAARCGVAAAGCAPRLRVLDVGGGKGHYAAFAEQQGWEYSTIDVETPSTRGSGFNHEWGLHRNSLTYDGRKLPFGAASFDLVIVNFVLHHAAENTIPLLQQIRDIATRCARGHPQPTPLSRLNISRTSHPKRTRTQHPSGVCSPSMPCSQLRDHRRRSRVTRSSAGLAPAQL
jgi:SAM-dependent methyltransferase